MRNAILKMIAGVYKKKKKETATLYILAVWFHQFLTVVVKKKFGNL